MPPWRAHLEAGGTVVAMGESRSDLWLPGVAFIPRPTNWWWWCEPGAELGVEIAAPGHPLMAGLDRTVATWHLHGHFDPPGGAEVLVRDAGDPRAGLRRRDRHGGPDGRDPPRSLLSSMLACHAGNDAVPGRFPATRR